MLQDLTELDFDAYFDVANSNQPSRDILYHDESQHSPQPNDNIMLPSINSPDNRTFNYLSPLTNQQQQQQQQQQQFNLFDWDMQPSAQHSPSSSPLSSSDGYTSHSLSPTIHSPPFNLKNDTNKTLGLFDKKSAFLDVPGINIPTTPISEISSQQAMDSSNHSNLPSPPLDTPFSTINQWNQFKNDDDLDTKHWRKTTRQANIRTINDPTVIHGPGKQLKKVAHNAIERRYRNNINDRIHELKNVVPALYKARICPHDNEDSSESETEIVDGVEVAKKLNKATILKKATEYIQFLKTTNEKTDSENMILQQIIAQMPGGQQVLTRFLYQKKEYERSENERLTRERHEAQERERVERQKLLRERAAQRAALAQLMPKQERRPYRRRQSKKDSKKSNTSEDENSSGNKMFMAAFMCLVFFAAPSSSELKQHETVDNMNRTTDLYTEKVSSMNLWTLARYILYASGLFYLCILPLVFRWLRPKPVKQNKKCAEHCHYDQEVPATWNRLYLDLTRSVGTTSSKGHDLLSIVFTLLDTLFNLLYLLIPTSILNMIHKTTKPVGCPEELSKMDAWIRLNEMESLGGNPHVSRLSMLHSSIAMLAHLHKMKRDKNYASICGQNTLDRVYTTAAIQLELCFPSFSSYFSHWIQPELSSECHDQVLKMLSARNGFQPDQCRQVMYSYVLPYLTSPLDLLLYWQQLETLKESWHDYLNGTRPVFSEKQLSTLPGHLLQWQIRIGLGLESLATLDQELLATNKFSSSLLNKHASMILHLLEAASLLIKNDQLYKVASLLEQAKQERQASIKCIQQLNGAVEANVMVLSTLAVHLRTLKALIVHGTELAQKGFSAQQAAIYIAQLRDQVLQDLESPFARHLSAKCKKHIQLYIYQADDTLSL